MLARHLVLALALAGCAAATPEPDHYVYVSAGEFDRARPLLERDVIVGAQVIYAWKDLEIAPDDYDFSLIHAHLAATDGLDKMLVVQIQDRFFSPGARRVPRYLLDDPRYGGGLAPQVDDANANAPVHVGWVAMHWNDAVRARYQALLEALADEFDGRVRAVVLPETAAEIGPADAAAFGFECDAYFDAEMENFAFANQVFTQSDVILFANFWPCEWNDSRSYMSRTFAWALANGAGLGGPDIVPWREGQMANAYPFLHRHRGQLAFVGMSIQEPTLAYIDPATGAPFTRDAFVTFARDHLGVDAIFWSADAPWLTEGR